MRTFHSSLSYSFPEIAEAIDLHLFKSLNDSGIQARSGAAPGDPQEVGAGSTADLGHGFCQAQAQSHGGITVTFLPACKTQKGSLRQPSLSLL